MAASKGHTLLEIIVVLVIIGLATAMILPNLRSSSVQSKAEMAQTKLLAILAAQEKYFEDYNVYCTATTGNVANCGNSTLNLDANLRLSISEKIDPFAYACAAAPAPYQCTATDATDSIALTLSPAAVSPANPVTCIGPSGDCPY